MNAPKKRLGLGKIIAGLVIGGAVGSVIGLTLAPQDGKKTRKFLKDKAGEAFEKGKGIVDKMREE